MNDPTKGRRLAGLIYVGAAAPVLLIGLAPLAIAGLLQSFRDSLVRLAQLDYVALAVLVVVGTLFGLAVGSVPLAANRSQSGGSRRPVLASILAGTVIGLLCALAVWRLWPMTIGHSLDVTLVMWTTSLGAYLAALAVALVRSPDQNRQAV